MIVNQKIDKSTKNKNRASKKDHYTHFFFFVLREFVGVSFCKVLVFDELAAFRDNEQLLYEFRVNVVLARAPFFRSTLLLFSSFFSFSTRVLLLERLFRLMLLTSRLSSRSLLFCRSSGVAVSFPFMSSDEHLNS
jgi:hypothetical protein